MPTQSKPWLLGIVVDASYSMRQNWQNRDGRNQPRFVTIRDALNRQLWKISTGLLTAKNDALLFCLGMGFRTEVTFAPTALEQGHERQQDVGSQTITQANLVCDLLALNEAIPRQAVLQEIEHGLNEKWRAYADQILTDARSRVENDAYSELQAIIESNLRESAYNALHRSWQYRLHTRLQTVATKYNWSLLTRLCARLSQFIDYRTRKIEAACTREGVVFLQRIQQRTNELFLANQSSYQQFIQERLNDFANQQIRIALELLTAKHSSAHFLQVFDEKTAYAIAEEIYNHLDRQVRMEIQKPAMLDFFKLAGRLRKDLGAKLDRQEIKRLTEQCVRKSGWETLEPFVQNVVKELIAATFKERAEKMLLYWVTLATSREVTCPITRIQTLLPELSEENVLSDKYMFGTTPVQDALNRASIRLLDAAYTDSNKLLLIISDGQFQINQTAQDFVTPVEMMACLLKQANVIIVCLYVTSRNVISRLLPHQLQHWPEGAKVMHQIASTFDEDQALADVLQQHYPNLIFGNKLCLQINQSEQLEVVLELIVAADDAK